MSLRTKGIWMLALFIIFIIFTSFIIDKERSELSNDTAQIQAVHIAEETQFSLYMSVARAVLIVNENHGNKDTSAAARRIAIEIDAILAGLNGLVASHSSIANDIAALQKNLTDLDSHPSLVVIIDVRNNLHQLIIDLSDISAMHRKAESFWMTQYNRTFQRLSLEWTLFAIFGVVTLGSLVMIFITRLAWDIRRVQDRALQIVEGYRGEPLAVTRNDELGSLMEGINRMQLELRQREIQVELSRQQQFHKEKMAAVGSLAAAVAHEINNPLSAIVGLSQGMSDLKASNQCNGGQGVCQPEALQVQARRVMEITRQIFEFSAPQSAEAKLLDLNNLISSTAKFVSFDRRFRSIDLVLALDPQLPAVYAVGDHITQVLMNLLINAADASDGRAEPRPRVVLSSHRDECGVVITVADNGPGMEPAILTRVFEEFFTTKPPGKGTGIGLAVSKSLIEAAGGSIAIASELGAGTTVTIKLPATTPDIDHIEENKYARTGSR
ncbi:MAG TPA: ATP-binding protein [Novimethylophilus sp.]|uniref:sensor histidine kinase n=1 Tax=Novimethylophilus sp. TaxID=2137426 RepID=UPI002F3EA64E